MAIENIYNNISLKSDNNSTALLLSETAEVWWCKRCSHSMAGNLVDVANGQLLDSENIAYTITPVMEPPLLSCLQG